MPISREEFDSGRVDLALAIREVLAGNPGLAFTPEDLSQVLPHASGRESTPEDILVALNSLVADGAVEHKVIGGKSYYAILLIRPRRLGFRPE